MSAINTSRAVEKEIRAIARDNFLAVLRFWQDSDKTVPLNITASTFKMQVRDKAGALIVEFTMTSGLTIQNTNELAFDKKLDVALGRYRYDLVRITGTVEATIMRGDFVVVERETQTT